MDQEQKYANGCVVQLNSGGPKMTVQSFEKHDGRDEYLCIWMEIGRKQTGWFIEESIFLVRRRKIKA